MNRETIREHLLDICRANGGILKAEEIVEVARDEHHPLHPCFEWDDSLAAAEFRLVQARKLIRITVEVLPQTEDPVRAFVSLMEDRRQPGGGYRLLEAVLSDEEMRDSLLHEALAELNSVRVRYKGIQALAGVWAAMKEVEDAHEPQLADASSHA